MCVAKTKEVRHLTDDVHLGLHHLLALALARRALVLGDPFYHARIAPLPAKEAEGEKGESKWVAGGKKRESIQN